MMMKIPAPGMYLRRRDGVKVQVIDCTSNGSFLDTVTVKTGNRSTAVRLENFWKKYEAIGEEGN